MRAPDLVLPGVGVAGFEPTASSSRTAGRAVDRVISARHKLLGAIRGRCWSVSLLYFAAVPLRSSADRD